MCCVLQPLCAGGRQGGWGKMSTSVARAPRLEMRSAASWALLLFATGLDYLTTRARLAGGHGEVNSLIARLGEVVGHDAAILAIKLPAVLLVGLFWLVLPPRYRDVGVAALATVWVVGALWDALVVAGVGVAF